VFISGDQHWAELMAKRMPASDTYGPSVVLYEVTASGIDQWWDETILNSNRLRIRTADNQGDGVFDKECNFPFISDGVTYTDCTSVGRLTSWCAVVTDSSNNMIAGGWGYCLNKTQELAQDLTFSNEETCTDQVTHVCTAQVILHPA
jgi:alkaline phosphatase D